MSGKMVTLQVNGRSTQGYLSIPKSGKWAGVLVLQEWWGLVDHIKDVCDRFSHEGFVALAPDLYHGKSADGPDEAGRLMMALNIDEAAKDLSAAGAFLASQPAVISPNLGVIGFCMGGQLALFAASKNSAIRAVADFYGVHPNVSPNFKSIQAAVLGIFAEKDAFVTPEVVRRLEGDLKEAGVSTDFQIFPGVSHAFFNDTRPDVYDQAVATQAWDRTTAHFQKHLV